MEKLKVKIEFNCLASKKEVEEHGKGSLSNRYNFLNSGGFSFYYQD